MNEPDSPRRRLPELRWQPVLAVERIRKTTYPSQKQRGGVVHHLAFDLFRERIAVGWLHSQPFPCSAIGGRIRVRLPSRGPVLGHPILGM